MELFIYYFVGHLFGKYEKQGVAFINKQIFKLRYIFSKKGKKNYNDFYECSFTEKDFEKGD